MASFVESATLKVNDQSSAQIRRINAELKKLFATARSLKSVKVDIRVNDHGLKQAAANAKQLSASLQSLRAAARNINVSVNTAGLKRAQQQIQQLRTQTQRPITLPLAPPAPRRQPAAAGGGRRGQGPVGAGLRGAVSGSGITGVAGMYGAFGAVAVAGYEAARALRSVADNAAKSDRTRLQAAVAATEDQRKVFAAAGDRPEGAGPISFTKNERDQLRTSLLGDVQGIVPKGTPDTAENRAAQRAKAAVEVAKQLETTVLPRMFAQAPGKSREETLEGLRKLVQGVNLASTDIVDSSGKFSQDGLRVLNGIQKAMAADPDISPALVKSTLANLKTAGYTLDEDSLARVLINAGSRGVRAANEAFQAMRSTGGTADIKGLNDSLEKLGLISGGKRKGTKGDKGLVPGSSKVKDPELWATDPATWFQKNYVPGMEAKIKAQGVQPGTKEWDVARKNQIEKDFAGAKSSAVQGITDMVLGFDQMNQTLQQANDAMKQNVPEAIAKSWIAQAESVKTAWADAAGNLGQLIADKINLADILKGVADSMRDNPAVAAGMATAMAGFTAAAGAAVVAAVTAPFTSLTTAGTGLSGAAAELTAAAAVLQGKGAIPEGGPGAPGEKGQPKPTKEAPKGRMRLGRMLEPGSVARVATSRLAIGAAAIAAAKVAYDYAKNAPTLPQRDDIWSRQALAEAKREREAAQRARMTTTSPEEKDAATANIERLNQTIASLEATLARQETADQAEPPPPPTWIADVINALRQQKPPEGPPPQLPPDWKPTPAPVGGQPETKWPDPTAISSASEVMKAAMEAGGTQIQGAANTLQGTTGTFQSVFATGAQAIGSSGQIAASTLQGAAPGIGASIGQAAASAIQAAVSNLNVNVNVKQSGGGDQGNINNANGNK